MRFLFRLDREWKKSSLCFGMSYESFRLRDIEVLQEQYGNISETEGLPSSNITKPALVITPHKNARRNLE
jgi:anaerobic dimethyl sulfoxide reductase subunit B (iron-sulfur subunit)